MSPITKRKVRSMSALPVPPPEPRRSSTRKKGLRKMARLLEERMDKMGLTEDEKNAKISALVERVEKLKSGRAESRPK